MNSYSVALPLQRSSLGGFQMITNIKRLIRQNLKMLVLTNPGERVMEPNFGVGLTTFVFNNFHENTMGAIDAKIRQQVSIYMPAISIIEISFGNTDPDNNYLGIMLAYAIPGIGAKDLLEFTI